MIWVAWRQQRAQLLTLAGILLVGAIAVIAMRASMVSDLQTHNLSACLVGGVTESATCAQSGQEFQGVWFDRMKLAQAGLVALPILLGIFCGAPLFARELEQGTHVLAFTQSVSRTRWMATKFLVAIIPAIVVLIALQLLVSGWVGAAGALGPNRNGPLYFLNFDTSSLAPTGYLLFAFTLAMFIGVLSRRTLVAMSVALGVFTVVRYVVNSVHLEFLSTRRLISDDPTSSPAARPEDIQVSGGFFNAQGAVLPDAEVDLSPCASRSGGADIPELETCYRQLGLDKSYLDVIPSDSATGLQLAEFACFGGVSVLLLAGTAWLLRKQR